jgi:glutathione S-transferase/GST-like protein
VFKLYWAPRTGAFAPETTLIEAGAAFEAIRVDIGSDEQAGAAYARINPMRQIPALLLPDGSVMTESAAISLYLADAHPGAGLVPEAGDPRRARLLRWLLFAVCNIYESDLRHHSPDRYTSQPDGAPGVKAAAALRMDRSFDLLDTELGDGPFLLGAQYSIADPYFTMLACWHYDTAALLARCQNLARLCRATRERPAIADALGRYDMARDLATL